MTEKKIRKGRRYPSKKKRRRNRKLRESVGACQRCGTTENLTVDHIKRASEGGTWALINLQVLCLTCNQARVSERRQ